MVVLPWARTLDYDWTKIRFDLSQENFIENYFSFIFPEIELIEAPLSTC